jgi:hypothetical protein
MYLERFYDQTLEMIDRGETASALNMITGQLHHAYLDTDRWDEIRATLHRHPLHATLMQDPFCRRSVEKPRGYPGDAVLIDFLYEQRHKQETTALGNEMFAITTASQPAEGVRQRRLYAEAMLAEAWRNGQRVLVLAGGHLREADPLIGRDLGNVMVVDQDPASLEFIRNNHGDRIGLTEANVFRYLKQGANAGLRFDLIYTLGLTDYLNREQMILLHMLMKGCLSPGGRIVLANFLPAHLGIGWMDAVMDWQLIYRDEAELESYAAHVGMTPRCWRDTSGSIVWCEMHGG